jgi:hypothetical protein
MSPEDRAELYREKIAEAWREVVASGGRHVGALVALGKLLNEAKETRPTDEDGKQVAWLPYFGTLTETLKMEFGLGKAEKLMGIAAEPLIADSSNWENLPPHLSTLDELRKIDSRAGEGTLARAFAAKLIHPDMTKDDVDQIVEALVPPPKLSPVEEAALAPAPRPPLPKKKPKELIEAETTIQELRRAVESQKEARGDLALDSIFVRSQVLCTLCGLEHWLENAYAQRDVTMWIKAHINESHPGEERFVSVRYTIDRSYPPPAKQLTEEDREEGKRLLPGLAQYLTRPALPACTCPEPAQHDAAPAPNEPEASAAEGDDEPEAKEEGEEDDQPPAPPAPQSIEPPAAQPDVAEEHPALAVFCRREYGE